MKIALEAFSAEIPRIADHLLPEGYAKLAQNCNVARGDLRSFRAPLRIAAITETAAKSLYKWEEGTTYHWVVSNTDRNYVKSPVSGDTYDRVYFTGEAEARFFANDNISGTPPAFDQTTDYYKLGIPAPTEAPTVTTTGGGAVYKGYVYSYVNSYGDEGPPSPVGFDTDYDSGNVTIANVNDAPTGRAINRVYLYRTNASTTGTAAFQYVLQATWFSAAVNYTVGQYVIYTESVYKCTTIHPAGAWNAGHFTVGDDVTDANLLTVFPKTNYDPPPAGLMGLVSMSYGGVVGFKGRDIYFSEPFYPHAFPTDYIVPVFHDIVGMASEKNVLTVSTTGPPYIIYGNHPSAMTRDMSKLDYPGLSIRSITSGNNGVYFSTEQGLIYNSGSGFVNVTESSMTLDDWAEYSPSTLAIYWHQKKLFCFDSVGDKGLFIDFSQEAIQIVPLSLYAHAGHVTDDGDFFMICDDVDMVSESSPPENMPLAIKQWDADTTNYMLYTWMSKEFISDYDTNFSIAHIILDDSFYDEVNALLNLVTLNASIFAAGLTGSLGDDGSLGGAHELAGDEMLDVGTVSMSPEIIFKLYSDNVLRMTKNLTQSLKFRLPAKYLSDKFYLEVSGYAPVKRIILATSADEL